MRHRWIWIGLFAILALATRWWLLKTTELPDREQLAVARSDYLLLDFNLRAMDEAGKLRFALTAPTLEKNPVDDSVIVNQPRLRFATADSVDWQLVADDGWISADGSEVHLRGDVRLNGDDQQQTRVLSEQLDFFPDGHRVTSTQSVTMRQTGIRTSTQGIIGELEKNRWELLDDVEILMQKGSQLDE